MAGYQQAGVDLDSKFMARVNAKRADVGYQIAGSDISNRYEAIGSGTKIANVGYQYGGVDISNYFRNISQPLSPITLSNMTVTSTVSGGTAFAAYNLENTGDITGTAGNNTNVDLGDWINPKTGMSGFSVWATNVSGTGAGLMNQWLNMQFVRNWEASQSGLGSNTRVIDFQMRRDSTGVVEGTCRVTFIATRNP